MPTKKRIMPRRRHCPDCGTRLNTTMMDELTGDQDDPTSTLVRCKNNHAWRWSLIRPHARQFYYETFQAVEPEPQE